MGREVVEQMQEATLVEKNTEKVVEQTLLPALFAATVANRAEAVSAIVTYVNTVGTAKVVQEGLFSGLKAALSNKLPATREGALVAIAGLLKDSGRKFEAHIFPLLTLVFDKYADKTAGVRDAASNVANAISTDLNPAAVGFLLPMVLAGVSGYQVNSKLAALELLQKLAKACPNELAMCLPEIVPALTTTMYDTKKEVREAATAALAACAAAMPNKDVAPFVPSLLSCMSNPKEVPQTVYKLAATTFVQQVTAQALALVTPVLVRGLLEGKTPEIRCAALIIDNMAKLVTDERDALVFMPKVLPRLKRATQSVSNPEAREVCEKALKTLVNLNKGSDEASETVNTEKVDRTVLLSNLKACIEVLAAGAAVDDDTLNYVVACAVSAINVSEFAPKFWSTNVVTPFLTSYVSEQQAGEICTSYLDKCRKVADTTVAEESDEEGVNLCNCEFTLAYGTKVLLNMTRLHLKRGRRYGLVGPNGCGKSTLMRSIVNGQVDGFPPREELKTVYVEADIGAEYAENTVLEYVFADPALKGVSEEEIRQTLQSVGFTELMLGGPVTSLSGGWKMKLALARAMLQHADILLCDEPTNHLDVSNVTWVVDYMCSLKEVTVIVVSHDKGFLDRVCTHIIQCDHLRLRNFKGNMTQFVAAVPEAAAYLTLKSTNIKWTFPEPCFIKGIKSKGKVLLRMKDVEFTYPNTTRQILHGVGIQVSMSSRIAVIGPNGAGKSTMIKLLTGEMEPSAGTCWKHGEMLMAYVAQHAFHHIEQHLEKTPNEYIRWRYQGGMDKEAIGKQSLKATPEEQKIMDQEHLIDKIPHRIERLGERRTRRGLYEYEVLWLIKKDGKWVQKIMAEPDFQPRDKLLKFGWSKPIQKIDEREAAGPNSSSKVLSEAEVEKHLALFGLEREFATHTRMDALSTSQKVKVVIGAAVWDCPHIIVLDEPTNYLDRESLGALADAIRDFQGGVVMISHNNEFTEALCTEQWAMKDGRLTVYGEVPQENAGDITLVDLSKEDKMDASGNVTKAKVGKALSRKEARKKKKGGADDDEDDDNTW